MTERPTRFGRIHAPDEKWLGRNPPEPILYTGKQKEVFESWKLQMAELARCGNVSLKLGGMMMRLAAYDYRSQPKPPTSTELAALWNAFKHITAGASAAEKRALFSGSARRVYRLE
jgi:predicted TIM-barrel fold metal-dependent hydrolase